MTWLSPSHPQIDRFETTRVVYASLRGWDAWKGTQVISFEHGPFCMCIPVGMWLRHVQNPDVTQFCSYIILQIYNHIPIRTYTSIYITIYNKII